MVNQAPRKGFSTLQISLCTRAKAPDETVLRRWAKSMPPSLRRDATLLECIGDPRLQGDCGRHVALRFGSLPLALLDHAATIERPRILRLLLQRHIEVGDRVTIVAHSQPDNAPANEDWRIRGVRLVHMLDHRVAIGERSGEILSGYSAQPATVAESHGQPRIIGVGRDPQVELNLGPREQLGADIVARNVQAYICLGG